ncbi:VanZ family protein [Alsobacter sp. SYSU BS001988]
MTLIRVARVLAWLLALAIVVVTVCPIGFRPSTGLPADLERFAAFGLVGLMFGLAYPRHRLVTLAAFVVGAAGLEVAQNFSATRHGRIEDFEIKALAGALGALSSMALGTQRNSIW